MKTLTCEQMGGMCDAPMSAATKDEMVMKGMQHVEAVHPEMAESIKSMPKDHPMMVDWQKKFDATWEATPETPAA